MELKVGSVVEGKVTGIMKFGAFVSLGDNMSGLVHISEISRSFVKEVSDYLQAGQEVRVKVIGIENGKIKLSMKALEEETRDERPQRTEARRDTRDNTWDSRDSRDTRATRDTRETRESREAREDRDRSSDSLDDMLKRYMVESELNLAAQKSKYERRTSRKAKSKRND